MLFPASDVAPLAGAWIEISALGGETPTYKVAPLAGAWIEINWSAQILKQPPTSLPSRERGLKLMENVEEIQQWGSLPSRERGLK